MTKDYKSTVFLPKTDFPMKAELPRREPAMLARWKQQDLNGQIRRGSKGRHSGHRRSQSRARARPFRGRSFRNRNRNLDNFRS